MVLPVLAVAGGILATELWYERLPTIRPTDVLAEVRRSHPDADLLPGEADRPFMIAFPSLTHRFTDGSACLLVTALGPAARTDSDRPHDFTQSWTWQRAAAVWASTTHTVLITDLVGRVHPHQPRVSAFRAVLDAVLAQTRPTGTWWPQSEVALPPASVTVPPLAGLVNVRLFSDANRPGNILMDTLGLHALGLPDLQMYFRGLEEGRVAGSLFALAEYVFNGAHIQPGHTVEGLTPGQRWLVSHEAARVGPDRLVLNLAPGTGPGNPQQA